MPTDRSWRAPTTTSSAFRSLATVTRFGAGIAVLAALRPSTCPMRASPPSVAMFIASVRRFISANAQTMTRSASSRLAIQAARHTAGKPATARPS